jgi:hypothetical protein
MIEKNKSDPYKAPTEPPLGVNHLPSFLAPVSKRPQRRRQQLSPDPSMVYCLVVATPFEIESKTYQH